MKKIDNKEDLNFINNFSNIKVTDACKKFKIDYSNLKKGTTTKENTKRVRKYLENEIAKIYLEDTDNYVK